jgi:para-nitrobenzyl esterase
MTIVDTRQGTLEGSELEGVLVFKGIPYAAPPVRERRFAPPAAAEPWDGVRAATSFGANSPQGALNLEKFLGGAERPESEDCLYLNVWTPAADDARRPVMVWIHGGAFTSGSGGVPWYHGTRFAQRGTVVVTINYRLGPFGFTHLGDLGGEAFAGSGNAGILDQVAALEWVRDNIAAFGGDPGNVTVFGESAGAMSIGTLLGLPAARGLFRRAILQSGASSTVRDAASASEIAERLLSHAGVGIDDVRDVPTETLTAAATALSTAAAPGGLLPFEPVVDGVTLPRPPLDAVRDGSVRDVALVIGTNLDEWHLFSAFDPRMQDLDDGALVARMVDVFGDADRAHHALDVYRRRLGAAPSTAVLSAVMSDSIFRIPAIRLAEAQLAAGGDAWMYLFTWATPAFGGALGSCHALEIPFVFDGLARGGVEILVGGTAPQSLADEMHGRWTSFARNGDPGWPVYDTDRRPTMRFDVDSSVVDDPYADERAVWP